MVWWEDYSGVLSGGREAVLPPPRSGHQGVLRGVVDSREVSVSIIDTDADSIIANVVLV